MQSCAWLSSCCTSEPTPSKCSQLPKNTDSAVLCKRNLGISWFCACDEGNLPHQQHFRAAGGNQTTHNHQRHVSEQSRAANDFPYRNKRCLPKMQPAEVPKTESCVLCTNAIFEFPGSDVIRAAALKAFPGCGGVQTTARLGTKPDAKAASSKPFPAALAWNATTTCVTKNVTATVGNSEEWASALFLARQHKQEHQRRNLTVLQQRPSSSGKVVGCKQGLLKSGNPVICKQCTRLSQRPGPCLATV